MRKNPRMAMPFLLLLFAVSFSTCKKNDFTARGPDPGESVQKFFAAQSNTEPLVQAVKAGIQKQNAEKGFVPSLVGYAGYPLWNKAMVAGAVNRNVNGRYTYQSGDQFVYIPFAKERSTEVASVLLVKINRGDTAYHMLYHWQYADYGFGRPTDSTWNAMDVFHIFSLMNYYAYGHTIFKLTDLRIIGGRNSAEDYTTLKLRARRTGREMLSMPVTACDTYDVCTYPANLGDDGWCNGGNCTTDCEYWTHAETTCTTFWIDFGGGGGSGGGGDGGGPPAGGGGGGGGGGGWYDNPCRPMPGFENPCDGGGSGWDPIPIDDDRDPNGFLYSRLAELQQKIAQDPYALLECDELNIMPLEDQGNGFGNMYKRIAQYTVPQSVLDRIDHLEQTTTWSLTDDFYVQNLDDASGSIVNCDFFAVRIQSLPTGWTPDMLLEHFRKNLNALFITPPVATQFNPYVDNGIDDTQLFNSAYENSLGALVSIYLNWIEKGSVVLSDYYRNNTLNQEKFRFKFTTMATPLDWNHPVSGHREFGIYRQPDGAYAFYIMGVDRASGPVYASMQNTIFSNGDELWENIQQNMINYVNSLPGGQAGTFSNGTIKARPKWDDVREYLHGDIDWNTLRQRLGC